jgi:YVTN family beta-propeller protein
MHLAVVLLLSPALSLAGANDGYVGCTDSDDCVAFDLTTYSVYAPIDLNPEGLNPGDATMTPDGSEVWICGETGDGVVVIDVATNTVAHTLAVGDYPNSICFTDDGRLALISSRNDDEVALVDTRTYRITGSLHVAAGMGGPYDGPGQMALEPASRKIYAVDWYGPTIYEIARDASEVVRHAAVGENLWQLVCDPLGRYIYVTDRGTDQVRVIDQQTLTEVIAIDVSDNPMGIDVTRDATKLVVPCEDHSNVFIINTLDWSTHALPLQLNADPRDVDILDSAKLAFITGGKLTTGAETYVYVVNLETNQLIWQFQLTGADASVIAVQPQMTSEVTGVTAPAPQPPGFHLACHPNPFNPTTTIRYVLPEPGEARVAIYEPHGRLVAVLEDGWSDAGEHLLQWDGRTADGRPAATGVYLLQLSTDAGMETAKAVLLK